MTTTAFTLLFLPACLAVPAGLTLGILVESVIQTLAAAAVPSRERAASGRPAVARPGRPADAAEGRRPRSSKRRGEGRRDPSWLGLSESVAPVRRDEMALLSLGREARPAPWM